MRKLTPFLACLMLVLTSWTGTACAAQNMTCFEVPQVDTAMHMAADCDQVPADANKGYPHHHAACHGHHMAAPVEGSVAIVLEDRSLEFASDKAPPWLGRQGDPALRPPQA